MTDGLVTIRNQTFSISVNRLNENAPIANDGFISLDEDQVSTAASDVNGVLLTHLSGISSDEDLGDTLTFNLETQSTSGLAVVNGDGTFSYDFDETLEESNDSFEYRVTDEMGQTDVGTCLLYTSPSPRDATLSRMPSSA